jgi:outer membrane protein assembly factor BamB
MKARMQLALACALGIFLGTAAPAFAVEPVVVVDTDKPELGPAASTEFLAWLVLTPRGQDFHPNVRAEAIGSTTSFRVNPKGTSAVTGGIDGSTFIYERFSKTEKSDLVMVDLSTQTELEVPAGVNTNAIEFSPSISGSHLLFGRSIRHGAQIILFDTSTGSSLVIYSRTDTERRGIDLLPIQVNGNFAVWQQVTFSKKTGNPISADILLYDIGAATVTKIPKTDSQRPSLYGPSVDEDGTVYFGRSSFACGENAQLVSRDLAGTESVLLVFPRSRDFSFSVAVDNPDNTTDVYFDRANCRGDDFGDIWKLPSV